MAPEPTASGPPRFLDAGEAALVVEFGLEIDPAVSARVLVLDAAIRALGHDAILETVPTFRSLMIHYDPLGIDREALIGLVRGARTDLKSGLDPAAEWRVPCCYDPEFGEDIRQVADTLGMTEKRLVELHSGPRYRIYMYGFAPGFCYLGGLPPELGIPRRQTPRPPHPANTILMAGGMTLISTFSMPTGWYLMGRTPERMFSIRRERTFFAEVGDAVRFEPVDRGTFDRLERRTAEGEIVARRVALR